MITAYYLWDAKGTQYAVTAAEETPEFRDGCEQLRLRARAAFFDQVSRIRFVRCLGVV